MTDIKQKLSFSNSYPNSGTTVKYDITFNTQVDYLGFIDDKSADFSFKLKSTVSSLYCLGQLSSHSFNLKKVILENADLKMTSSNTYSSTIFSDFKDAFAPISIRIMDESSMKESIDSKINMFETFNQGNEKITIKNTEGFKIDAGEGKDIVVGNKGDDTIIGGAGSDKLTGGKGADTFSFDLIDFFDINDDGNVVYNNVVDTITDFNVKEHDVLDFDDSGNIEFYTSLKLAELDNAHLFYIRLVLTLKNN